VSFSLTIEVVEVVRLRFAGRGGAGAGLDSSSERDAEFSEGVGRGCLEPARDFGRAVDRREVVLDLVLGTGASGKKGHERLDFLTRLRCSSLCRISV
jgi:hypothetical protein